MLFNKSYIMHIYLENMSMLFILFQENSIVLLWLKDLGLKAIIYQIK